LGVLIDQQSQLPSPLCAIAHWRGGRITTDLIVEADWSYQPVVAIGIGGYGSRLALTSFAWPGRHYHVTTLSF